jgi:hypothetical protein
MALRQEIVRRIINPMIAGPPESYLKELSKFGGSFGENSMERLRWAGPCL